MNSAEVLIKFKGDTTDADKATKEVSNSLGGLTKAFAIGNLAAKGITKAIDIFNSGLDDSINRIDTMNNFSTVMENLGIATQDSADVIQSLSEELIGLPTTLNSAASSVQRLTSYNGDIKKSEQYFLAMNNAIIAGTNDAGMQASAIEQLTQAYTKGKPDMQDWKTLLQAMPAQLKQVAQAMGYVKTDQLYEALKNGEVSMTDFMDTLVQLNATGTGEFASLEQQARANTAGIGTSITNMKTAFVRGIGGIVTSVDESLASFGGLSGVITTLGKAGEEAFKGVGDILSEIMPILIEVGQEIMPVLQDVLSQLLPPLKDLAKALLPAISKVFKKIMPTISKLIEKIMPLAVKMIDALIPLLDPLADFLASYIDLNLALLEPLMEILNVVLPPLVDILSVLISSILPVLTNLLNVEKTVIETVFGVIKGVISGLIDFIVGIPDTVIGVVNAVIGFITSIPGTVASIIGNITSALINFIIHTIPDFIGKIVNFFASLPGKIWDIVTSIPGKIKDAFVKGINTVKEGAQAIFDKIWDTLSSLPGKMFDLGKDILNGVKNGIQEALNSVGSFFSDIGNGIVGGFKSVLGIHSPSVVMKKEIGVNLGLGVVEGLDDTTKQINNTIGNIAGGVSASVGANLSSSFGSFNTSGMRPVVNVYNNMEIDPLGQTVSHIKTFSGGAKNDYNYGVGV